MPTWYISPSWEIVTDSKPILIFYTILTCVNLALTLSLKLIFRTSGKLIVTCLALYNPSTKSEAWGICILIDVLSLSVLVYKLAVAEITTS